MELEQKRILGNAAKLFLFLIPFLFGFAGILLLGQYPVQDCAYRAIQLYLMDFTLEPGEMNLLIELARWTAPLATATAVAAALYSLVDHIRIWMKLRTRDVIAVHGDSANIDFVLKNLGSRAVCSDKKILLQAQQHILMFNDDFDMYHFIDSNNSVLMQEGDKRLFLCTEQILRGSYEDHRLVVCNIAENCARSYWEKYPVVHDREKILLIGFGNYGQRMLTQAILKNVISVDSRIEYHVAGDYQEYLAKHFQMHKAVSVKLVSKQGEVRDYREPQPVCDSGDQVYFYDMEWYEILGSGRVFDRVILACDIDADNIAILNELKTYYVTPVCHIKFTDENIIHALWGCEREHIDPFGVSSELYEPEIILKEKLFHDAKMLHGRYFANYQCDGMRGGRPCGNRADGHVQDLSVCAECPAFSEDWYKLSTFLQYSNVAQADHIGEKLRLLENSIACGNREEGTDITAASESLADRKPGCGARAAQIYRALPEEKKTELWRIEHIRWCRYHFMNNWDYAPKRDNARRLHHLLVPFWELSYAEQKKDGDAYEALEELLR